MGHQFTCSGLEHVLAYMDYTEDDEVYSQLQLQVPYNWPGRGYN